MIEWTYCKDKLPHVKQFVLFCLNTPFRTVFTGSLRHGNDTPNGELMWQRDGTVFWYRLEDVLGWYEFPYPDVIYNGPKNNDILPITRTEYLGDEIGKDLAMYYREVMQRMMLAAQ